MVFMLYRQRCIILYVTEEGVNPPPPPPPPPILLPEDHKMPSLNSLAQFSFFILNRNTQYSVTFVITGRISVSWVNSTKVFGLKVRRLSMRGPLTLTSVTPENPICVLKTQKRKARSLYPRMVESSTQKGELNA